MATNLVAEAPSVKAHVVAVMASKDNLAVNSSTEQFLEKLSGPHQAVILKSAGHLLPFEEPERLAEAFNNYLLDNFYAESTA